MYDVKQITTYMYNVCTCTGVHVVGKRDLSNWHGSIYILSDGTGHCVLAPTWPRANVKLVQSHPVTWRKKAKGVS